MNQRPKGKKTVRLLKENTREMCLNVDGGCWGDVLPKIHTTNIYLYLYICQ